MGPPGGTARVARLRSPQNRRLWGAKLVNLKRSESSPYDLLAQIQTPYDLLAQVQIPYDLLAQIQTPYDLLAQIQIPYDLPPK